MVIAVNPLSIADVVASQIPLDWTEAVAIIGELCAVVLAVDASSARIPDAADVMLMGDGTLAIGPRAQEHDVAYGARLLHALLATSTTPAPLRLFVSRTISANQHASVGEFADALAYYERPGRPALLQKVFERCVSAPRQSSESSILLPSEPTAPPAAMRLRRRVPKHLVMTASVVAVLGTATAALWVSGVRVSPRSIGWGGLFGQAGTAINSLTDRIRQDLGYPTSRVEQREEQAAAQTPSITPRPRRAPQILSPVPGPGPEGVARPEAPAVEPSAAAVATAPAQVATSEPDDLQIYSSDATDVLPAVLEDQSLARLATSPEPPPGTNRIEVTVDPLGQVRRVRLVSGSTRMSDAMLLSAAKAWRFRPAQRNGRPVNYRLVLDWSAQGR